MIYFIYHGYVAKVRIICDIIVNALRFLSLTDGFCDGMGVNTDFHGWGCEIYDGFPRICGSGVSLTDFADDYLTQISQISRIFLSHRLLTCPGYSLRNSKLKTVIKMNYDKRRTDYEKMTCPGYSLRNSKLKTNVLGGYNLCYL